MKDTFEEFVGIVQRLRQECPWDRVQTFNSVKASTIEEVYEVVESIENKDFEELKLELGDLMLHVVLYSIMAEEKNIFNIEDVLKGGMEKLIRRHPHIFGDVELNSAEEVKTSWERIKLTEGRESVLDGVPHMMPSLQRAYRLQEKASKVGFDWDKKEDVWNKVTEELNELKETFVENDPDRIEDELGDFLFALVNYSRFHKINPENALRRTNEKFIRRFRYIEEKLKEKDKNILDSNLEEMDFYWNEAKKSEKQ
jgi:tetrapyrrole methylase family protein / MazG family protein